MIASFNVVWMKSRRRKVMLIMTIAIVIGTATFSVLLRAAGNAHWKEPAIMSGFLLLVFSFGWLDYLKILRSGLSRVIFRRSAITFMFGRTRVDVVAPITHEEIPSSGNINKVKAISIAGTDSNGNQFSIQRIGREQVQEFDALIKGLQTYTRGCADVVRVTAPVAPVQTHDRPIPSLPSPGNRTNQYAPAPETDEPWVRRIPSWAWNLFLIITGCVLLAGGVLLTKYSQEPGGEQTIFWGLVVVGAFEILAGLFGFLKTMIKRIS
jgi:hypothetical protein